MGNDKILFATDFDPGALQVLAQVERLAAPRGAEVLLMHAPSTWRAWISSGLDERQAEDRLRGWAKKLEDQGIAADVLVKRGSAAEGILEAAEHWGAHIIAIGAGESWREGHVVGTTAQAVVRGAECSVWIGVPTKPSIAKILCGFDGSDRSREALRASRDLRETLGAELTVLGALEGPQDNLLGTPPEEEKRLMEEYKASRQAELSASAAQELGQTPHASCWVWGRGSDALRAKAEDDGFDLVVLGRTGVGQVKRVLLGTTAERLLRSTPCSLFVVGRPPETLSVGS